MRAFTFRLTLQIFVKYPDALRAAPWRRYVIAGELQPGKILPQVAEAAHRTIEARKPG